MKSTNFIFLLFISLNVFGQDNTSKVTTKNSNVKEIIVVVKTHFDIGYTHRVKDVVHYYRTDMIDKALSAMDATQSMSASQQFKWTAPGWVMSKVMEPWQGQTQERRQRLDKAFKTGRFITHALPFTIESDISEPEVIVRGLSLASNLTRSYNKPLPISAKLTDMPSQSGQLATVLANSGVKFLHIGCNWPSGYVETPGIFWWEGPDGSRLLTFYSSIYGTATGLNWPQQWGRNERFVGRGLMPPVDWPYKVWPAILVTMDNTGPPKAGDIKALIEEVQREMPGVKIKMGSMDDFAEAFLADHPDLPVVKKEMPDTWVHGMMSDPGGSTLSRATAPLLAADEVLNTQLKNWGLPVSPVSDSIAKAYEMMALYSEHTWGGSASVTKYGDQFKTLPASAHADLEASWDDKTDYVRQASTIANNIKNENLQLLAQAVKGGSNRVVVYNPLPWKRNGLVDVDGQSVLVKNIPAGGYTTVAIRKEPVETISTKSFIENQFFKIILDPQKGAISSLIDKRTGRDWATNDLDMQTGQYFNERFTYEQAAKYTSDYQQKRAWRGGEEGDWLHPGINKPGMISEKEVPYRKASPIGGKLTIQKNRLKQIATMDMPADLANHLPATRLTVTLIHDQPYLDVEIMLLDKVKDNWPEADWLALPFNVKNPTFKVYRPLGIMNPATDIQKGANKDMYTVGHGVTMSDAAGDGIAIAPLDHPLISLDTPGNWKFSLDFVPKKPVVYINLYNNQWNTNYRYWYPGTWSSRVRIWTFDKNTPQEQIMAVPALEARNPLQAVVAEQSRGILPATQKGIELSGKGVVITAYGQDSDGNRGTLLRLWEMAGQERSVSVSLPSDKKFSKATPVNLRGEATGEPIHIADGKFTCNIKQFGPASFILE